MLAMAAMCAAAVLAQESKKPESAGGVDDAINNYILRVQKLSKAVEQSLSPRAFREVSESSRFKSLAADVEPEIKIDIDESGFTENELWKLAPVKTMIFHIDNKSRTGMALLAHSLVANDMTRKYWRFNAIAKDVVSEGYVKELADFAGKWDSFMGLVKEMKDSKATGVTGSELVVAAGLDAYAKPATCTMTGSFHRRLCSLGGCLDKTSERELETFEAAVQKIRGFSAKASALLDEDMATFNENKKRLSPASSKAFESLLTNNALFIVETEKFLDDAEKLVADIRSTSSDIGKLRALKGFSPKKAFLYHGLGEYADGNQKYVMRVRVALDDAKKAYLDALAVCNKEARLSGQQDIRGWK